MRREDHYEEAERLADIAVRLLADVAGDLPGVRVGAMEAAALYCQAGLIHATLATAEADTELAVVERAKAARRAEQAAAGRPVPGPHLHPATPPTPRWPSRLEQL